MLKKVRRKANLFAGRRHIKEAEARGAGIGRRVGDSVAGPIVADLGELAGGRLGKAVMRKLVQCQGPF